MMNILFIGSSDALSLVPFKRLLSSQHKVSAVGVANPIRFKNKIIALQNESLALAASKSNIPVIDLSNNIKDVLQQCANYSIDIILMSCYSKRLPDQLINAVAKGCFNMHPSLLPAYRGPEPVFWQMKQAADVGVSWHRVNHDFDAGDIVVQQEVVLHEGATYSEINQQLAETGAKLMMSLLKDVSNGSILSTKQNPELASYYPYPEKNDFELDTGWKAGLSAEWAYNYMCATQAFGHLYRCQPGKHNYLLKQALDYDNNQVLDSVETQGDKLFVPCNEGVLIATYTDKMSL